MYIYIGNPVMNFEYLLNTNVYFGGIHTFSETGLTPDWI
jgi:hypothetical protein